MAPGGFGAMLLMPVSGRLTDRYGPTWLPATGLPLVAIGLIPFVFIGAGTSYAILMAGQLRPGARNGPGDDAEHDRGDAGGAAVRDRPHEHRDEHHPPGRRLDRHRRSCR